MAVETAKAYAAGPNVPVGVRFDFASGQRVATSTTTARSTAIAATLVRLAAITETAYVRVGSSTVEATSNAAASFPVAVGHPIDVAITSGQYIAAITASGTGALYILPAVET